MVLFLLIGAIVVSWKLSELTANVSKETKGNKNKTVIVIDPGHGGEDPGKVGSNDVLEKDLNLQIAKKVIKRLKKQGITCIIISHKLNEIEYVAEPSEADYEYAKENPKWLDELKTMSYDDAMQSLMERKGIGKKVANCICLFGLHHVDAFPIDTHVKQLLAKYYQNGFDFDRYKGVAGIVQQYLFYYEIS